MIRLACRGAKVLAVKATEWRVTLGKRPVKHDSRVLAIDPSTSYRLRLNPATAGPMTVADMPITEIRQSLTVSAGACNLPLR